MTEEEKKAIEEMLFKIDKAQRTTFDFINDCYIYEDCNGNKIKITKYEQRLLNDYISPIKYIDFGTGESQSALCRKIEMKELEELMTYEYKSRKNNKNLLEKCDKLSKKSLEKCERS